MIWGKTPEAVLAAMGVPPDFRCQISAQTVKPRYIHRTAGDTDIYFVANGSPRAVDAECIFRVKGKRPEFWHPDTGRIEPVAVYEEAADGTRIPIWFDPAGSVFVVFRPGDGPAADHAVAITCDGKTVFGAARPAAEIVVAKADVRRAGRCGPHPRRNGPGAPARRPGRICLPRQLHGRRRRSGPRRDENG